MSVNIHGKQYITVAERVQEAGKDFVALETEVLQHSPVVVIKATVTTTKGVYSGISSANPLKAIEKTNPYEVAETSAVGRALGFAGYGIVEGIASADEMVKSQNEASQGQETPSERPVMYATDKQVKFIHTLLTQKGQSKEDLYKKYNVESINNLPIVEATAIIENLLKLEDKLPERDINEDIYEN